MKRIGKFKMPDIQSLNKTTIPRTIHNGRPLSISSFCGKWEGLDPVNRFDQPSWVAIVTQLLRLVGRLGSRKPI